MFDTFWQSRAWLVVAATVGIDAHGNSVYDDLKDSSRERLQQIFKELDEDRARGL